MKRRSIITATGGLLVGMPIAHAAGENRSKPEVGDSLVHAFGDAAGNLIHPEHVGRERVFAFPMAPDGTVRSGSLHNQVSILRVDESAMSEKTQRYAAGPFIAVSAACTHTGCEVAGWEPETAELVCPCHGSRFAVLDAARVTLGPATKPLAFLPIESGNGGFVVAGKFSRRVGPAPTF